MLMPQILYPMMLDERGSMTHHCLPVTWLAMALYRHVV